MNAGTTLRLATGDSVRIAQQGAQPLSWQTADGQEHLYLSPRSASDGSTPIRGGVPICFPQFNQRVLGGHATPKHGFARLLPWQLLEQQGADTAAQAVFGLCDSDQTRALWPYSFAARFQVDLRPGQLSLTFSVHNSDSRAWAFALALHSYLRVDDIAQARLHGLQGRPYWDAVLDPQDRGVLRPELADSLGFSAETDRVYAGAASALELRQQGAARGLQITQSEGMDETVVWNPGAQLCAGLKDMPADGYQHMLCVEAARINHPVELLPGQSWSGSQTLSTPC